MTPKHHFDVAMDRADHLLRLYDLLHDTRSYAARADWSAGFLELMHWPKKEKIVRVDGKDRMSILILRGAAGITRDKFTHEYLSELLRAAIVATVSALDRYMHDLVVLHSWTLLQRAESRVPSELKKLRIAVISARQAINKVRSDHSARPGVLVKKALREQLHREYTFQRPDDVHKAVRMLGIENFWEEVAKALPGNPSKKSVMDTLSRIVDRRNQIVHEADFVRKSKAKQISTHEVSAKTAAEWASWMRGFVSTVDALVAKEM